MAVKKRTKEDYEQAALVSYNLSDMCRYFGIHPTSSELIKHDIAKYNIDVSHFKIKVILHETHGKPKANKSKLKKELTQSRGHKCETCKRSSWMRKPITLHLDHIDGINSNNDISNLRLLCHNCHAQTPTFCRNILSIKKTLCPKCGNNKNAKAKQCFSCHWGKPSTAKEEVPIYKTNNLVKRKLIETNGHKCSICNKTEWQGVYIPIELDHIDGNSKNNNESNLRLLCPNCHSQTENWGSKNKPKVTNPNKFCPVCNNPKHKSSKRCSKCKIKEAPRKVFDKEYVQQSIELIEELEKVKRLVIETSFEEVGRARGVTGNAIKKLLKRNGIVPPKKHFNRFSESDDFCVCGNDKQRESKTCLPCANKNKTKHSYPDDETLKSMIKEKGIVSTYKELGIPRGPFHGYLKTHNIN